MEGYRAQIKEASKELTQKERVMLKDTSGATRLDQATEEGQVIIHPAFYAVVSIHNEKSDNPDYEQYVIVDESGEKYVTGSKSFWENFLDIWADMQDSSEEWAVECFKLESKNYKGKQFLTCTII